MKIWSIICSVASYILSCAMCAVVAYNYRGILCDIEHAGFSAPADLAFLCAIPFLVLISVCVLLDVVFYVKSNQK